MTKHGVFLAAMLAASGAHAGVIDLGSVMGGANVFTKNNFTAISSDVEGAIVAGGNVTIQNYAVNLEKQAAYGGYSIAAGGNVSLTSGTIHNGQVYAGGTTTLVSAPAVTNSTVKPVDFAAAAQQFADIAKGLSLVASTGKIERVYSGNNVTGNGNGVIDVFNVDAAFFNGGNNWVLAGLTAGQTLIFNISGATGGFNDGNIGFDPLKGFNVLFNFFEATSVDVRNIFGTVLAPYATVKAGWGQVNGQVIADTWDSSVQVNANHYFKPVDLDGFELVDNNPPVDVPSDVPEPGTLALMLAGLAGVARLRRRR